MKYVAGTPSEVRAASDKKVSRRLVEWLSSLPKWNVSSNYEAVGWTGKGAVWLTLSAPHEAQPPRLPPLNAKVGQTRASL